MYTFTLFHRDLRSYLLGDVSLDNQENVSGTVFRGGHILLVFVSERKLEDKVPTKY
jgi:hypothetical protein